MSKGLEAITSPISSELRNGKQYYTYTKEDVETIEQELKDYQEIKEIAKHYNWDEIVSQIYNINTDKKFRDLFDSAIFEIQEDYRKARLLEIIKKKRVDVDYFIKSNNLNDYNNFIVAHGFKTLTQEEYDLLKEALDYGK